MLTEQNADHGSEKEFMVSNPFPLGRRQVPGRGPLHASVLTGDSRGDEDSEEDVYESEASSTDGHTFQPVVDKGVQKYKGYRGVNHGLYSKNSFPASLPKYLVDSLIKAGNNSVAEGTWKQYKSVKKHLETFQKTARRKVLFPMSEENILGFIAYLFEKGLQGKSVSKMISALRKVHMTEGVPVPILRTDLVKDCLRGKDNFDEEAHRGKPKRLPVTLTVMRLIKCLLKLDRKMTEHHKILMWCICAVAFNGCLRIGECLSKFANRVDTLNCLLKKDIWLTEVKVKGKYKEVLKLRLKSDKASRATTRGVVLEIFGNGTDICPVKAYRKYLRASPKGKESFAAFRNFGGSNYRHQRFNEDLKSLLGGRLPYANISGHSFRIGFASLLAANGFSDKNIKKIGRWNSSAFKTYLRSGRVTRVGVADRVARAIG